MKSARCFVSVTILLLCASVLKAQEKAEDSGRSTFLSPAVPQLKHSSIAPSPSSTPSGSQNQIRHLPP